LKHPRYFLIDPIQPVSNARKSVERRVNASTFPNLMNVLAVLSTDLFSGASAQRGARLSRPLYRSLSRAPKRGAGTRIHARVSARHANREKRRKTTREPMKASIVGGFMRAGERPCGQRTRRGNENPICRHFCSDIVRLFISSEIERGREREGLLYCRIGILPRIRRRAFSVFFTFALARHALLYNVASAVYARAHAHARRASCEFRPFPRDGQSRQCRRKFPADERRPERIEISTRIYSFLSRRSDVVEDITLRVPSRGNARFNDVRFCESHSTVVTAKY